MMNTKYTQRTINEKLKVYGIKLWNEEDRMEARATHHFKNSNRVWYDGKFSTRDQIGGVMQLLNDCNPVNKETWIDFYFNSGDKASSLKSTIRNYKKINSINVTHGKTILEVLELAKSFHALLNGYSLEDCFNYAFIHIIDEPYLGYNREKMSEKILDDFCVDHGLVLNHANNYKDVVTGVDYEIRTLAGKLICGIQVKGLNTKYEATELMTNNLNVLKEKNMNYMEQTGVKVLFMYMDNNNELHNKDLFDEILKAANINKVSSTVTFQKQSQIDKFNKKFAKFAS